MTVELPVVCKSEPSKKCFQTKTTFFLSSMVRQFHLDHSLGEVSHLWCCFRSNWNYQMFVPSQIGVKRPLCVWVLYGNYLLHSPWLQWRLLHSGEVPSTGGGNGPGRTSWSAENVISQIAFFWSDDVAEIEHNRFFFISIHVLINRPSGKQKTIMLPNVPL